MLYGLIGAIAAFLGFVHFQGDVSIPKDAREQQIKYEHKLDKQTEKEKYERELLEFRTPNAFMTVDEYEAKSAPKDKSREEIEIPKVSKGTDMKYVPQPTYKIVRYNTPAGSPEISLRNDFHARRQQNAQGIVSPDFSIMVYPSVYYYPESNSTATDLFVVRLDPNESNLNKILKANVVHRLPTPILSTDSSTENNAVFRTLTPVDFSVDGRRILAKEKIGSSADGIWQTTPVIYDFDTNMSYRLIEVRDAIVYYWKENKGLDLDDKRWDIYPLGFSTSEPDRIYVAGYAYTGSSPVFLGLWSVDAHGEQSRLVSFNVENVDVGMNGFKIIQDGVVAPVVLKNEEKALRRVERSDKKTKKQSAKAKEKELKDAYKARLNELNENYKETKQDFNKLQSIQGSTSENDTVEKFREYKVNKLQKEVKTLEKLNEQDLKYIEKIDAQMNKLNEELNRFDEL